MENKQALSQLVAKYPRLFHGREPTCWSELPAGWSGLVDELCAGIECLLTPEELARFRVLQIKQKLGGLRFYWRLMPNSQTTHGGASPQGLQVHVVPTEPASSTTADAILALVGVAYEASLRTCEICGAQASLRRGDGPISTLCGEHAPVKSSR